MPVKRVCVVGISLCFVACTSLKTGRQVSPDTVGELERGVTTQAEVQRAFGTPTFRKVGSEGNSVWRYSYEEVRVKDTGTLTRVLCTFGVLIQVPACIFNGVSYRNGVTTRDELTITFDEELVVASYTYAHEEIPVSGTYDPVLSGPSRNPGPATTLPGGGLPGPRGIPVAKHDRSHPAR